MAATAKSSGKKRTRKANEALRKAPRSGGRLCRAWDRRGPGQGDRADRQTSVQGALSRNERALLAVLTDAVEKYESHAVPMPAVSDVEMLRHLIDANGLTQMKLAEETGIAMATISEILHGKRKMNVSHIRAFAKRFGVKAGAFLP